MVSVVVGHLSIPFLYALPTTMLYRAVHTFHVPLFFVIAGFFVQGGLSKHFKRLMIPCLITCFLMLIVRTIRFAICTPEGAMSWASYVSIPLSVAYGLPWWHDNTLIGHVDPVGPIWFLYALFFAFLLKSVLDNFRFGLFVPFLLFPLVIYGYKIGFPMLPVELQHSIIALCYVYVGRFIYTKYEHLVMHPSWILAAIGAFVFVVEYALGRYVDVAALSTNPIPYVLALPICYFVIWGSYLISHCRILSAFFEFIGKHTMPILCFHAFALFDIPWSRLWGCLCSHGVASSHARCIMMGCQFAWIGVGIAVVFVWTRLLKRRLNFDGIIGEKRK